METLGSIIACLVTTFTENNIDALITLLLALATVFMAIETRCMAKATEETLNELRKPNVLLYPQQDIEAPTYINLIITNTGTSPAFDVIFSSVPDDFPHMVHETEPNLSESKPLYSKPESIPNNHILRTGIRFLAPNEKRIIDWGTYNDLLQALDKTPISLTISFSRKPNDKKRIFNHTILDINDFSTVLANKHPITKIADSLRKIEEKL